MRAKAGSISFEGKSILGLDTQKIVERGIALVPEGRRIFQRMTVMETLQMGAVLADPTNLAVDLKRMFALFPILEELRGRRQRQASRSRSGCPWHTCN